MSRVICFDITFIVAIAKGCVGGLMTGCLFLQIEAINNAFVTARDEIDYAKEVREDMLSFEQFHK